VRQTENKEQTAETKRETTKDTGGILSGKRFRIALLRTIFSLPSDIINQ
jgi:hypothetical protein